MSGSFNHIVDDDGTFNPGLLEDFDEAAEALDECYQLIFTLADGDSKNISKACEMLGIVDPWHKKESMKL